MRRKRKLTVAMNDGRRLLKAQDELMRSSARVIFIGGGWGAGKSRGAAMKFLANCLANPWTAKYGNDAPFSLIIGFTRKILVDSSHRELVSILPPGSYVEKRSPDWTIILANGHEIRFRTVRGAMEGASACGVWLDEAHLVSESVYLNYQARVREPRANRWLMLCSGLPEDTWLRTTFADKDDDPDRACILASTYDNHYLPPHVVDNFLGSTDSASAVKYLRGQWMPREGVCFHAFDSTVHLEATRPPKGTTVHLSIDIGNKGCVLILAEKVRTFTDPAGRKYQETGLQVIDEILPSQMSVREAMIMVSGRGWKIDPAKTMVFSDPHIRRDEIMAIRDVLGDVAIVRKKRGDKAENVELGISAVNTALRNAKGETRLTFWKGLPKEKRSILRVITRYHRNQRTGRPVRDDTVDH